jgi:flagellar biosynthetic protein FliQ
METLDVVAVLHSAMITTLMMCAPLLLAPLTVGLLMALLQAVTQISDSALAFLPKLIATGTAGWLAGPFLARSLLGFGHTTFDRLIAIGGQ